jgi:hypothetical protein
MSVEYPANLREPWNNWYHLMGHTYGTWLPGDPRGFRTKSQRVHVDGDYKSPPPKEKYGRLHAYTKLMMKRAPVHLNLGQRRLAIRLLVESLQRRKVDVICACVDSIHFHILARVSDRRPDHWIGIAKRETSHYAKDMGKCERGGWWATGAKSEPIKNRAHQLATVRYILGHRTKGAAVWFKGKILSPTKA